MLIASHRVTRGNVEPKYMQNKSLVLLEFIECNACDWFRIDPEKLGIFIYQKILAMNDHLVVRQIEISKLWYITTSKMMRFHKIDHFEILMVMSHKSFIIFELGLNKLKPSLNVYSDIHLLASLSFRSPDLEVRRDKQEVKSYLRFLWPKVRKNVLK